MPTAGRRPKKPNLVPTSAEPSLLELCRVQPRLSKSEFIELLSVLRTEILQILCKPNAEREPAHAMLRRSQDYPNLYKSNKSVEPDASAIRYAYQFQSRWSIFRMVSPRPKDRHHWQSEVALREILWDLDRFVRFLAKRLLISKFQFSRIHEYDIEKIFCRKNTFIVAMSM